MTFVLQSILEIPLSEEKKLKYCQLDIVVNKCIEKFYFFRLLDFVFKLFVKIGLWYVYS